MHDPVTRLPNRTLFFERLTAALEAESYEQGGTGRIGLCYLDLDGFQAVNDTLGHRVGDRLLAAVAERLTRCADETGHGRATTPLVARLGGDEFALLVEDSTGTEQLADLAESLLKAVQGTLRHLRPHGRRCRRRSGSWSGRRRAPRRRV